jgi:hypothetical protein
MTIPRPLNDTEKAWILRHIFDGLTRAIGLSGTVQVAEQFPGVLSAATPRRAGSTARRSRPQNSTSLKVEVKLTGAGHTEWIGNDKSASRQLSAAHSAV